MKYSSLTSCHIVVFLFVFLFLKIGPAAGQASAASGCCPHLLRHCRESSRNAACKSCLSGAGRQLQLRRPGPAGVGAGALLSSRAAQGRILPGRGLGHRRGPRCTPRSRPRARRATACAARRAKRRSARCRRGRACARVQAAGEAVRTARRR